MSFSWEGYAQTVTVTQFTILDSAFSSALHRLSLMDTLAFSVLSPKFGTELIASIDAQPVKYGLKEIACALSTMSGMGTTVRLALEESLGMQQLAFAHVQQPHYGMASHVSRVMVVESSIHYQKAVFVL